MRHFSLLIDVTEILGNLEKLVEQIINFPMKLKACFTRPKSHRVADATKK